MGNNPYKISLSTDGLMALSRLKTMPEWTAMLALKESFIQKYKNQNFFLHPSSDSFVVDAARFGGKALGVVEFIEFIENSGNLLEDNFVEQIRTEDLQKASKS